METEKRFAAFTFDIQDVGLKNPVIWGKAAIYNSRSQLLGNNQEKGFYEEILPGFFPESVLRSDIIATVEHNNEKIVGRTTAATLKLRDSATALLTENQLPLTSVGKDLLINIQRGEIRGMSFSFRVKPGGDKWRRDPATGKMIRSLLPGGAERIFDVTYTTDPAYTDTSVALRSLQRWEEDIKRNVNWKDQLRERMLKLAKLSQGE